MNLADDDDTTLNIPFPPSDDDDIGIEIDASAINNLGRWKKGLC